MIKDKIEYDPVRAEEILFDNLMPAYFEKTFLYRYIHVDNGSAVQKRIKPKGMVLGSPEHIVFLFFADLMTYRGDSEQGFKQCVRLYDFFPWLFTKELCERSEETVAVYMKDVGFIHPNELARSWKGSGDTLFLEYGGDPLKIFSGIGSISEFIKKSRKGGKKKFPGLGPKLASLLSLFYEELGLIGHIRNAFPVDVHIQAECLATKIVRLKANKIDSVELAEFLRIIISEIAYKRGVKPLDLSHAMWFLGNQLCRYCRKNITATKRFCPIMPFCYGRPKTTSYRLEGIWQKRGAVKLPLFEK